MKLIIRKEKQKINKCLEDAEMWLYLGQGDVRLQLFFERMSVSSLLHGLENILVDAEGDGAHQGKQGEVCCDADKGEIGQGEENYENSAEHCARFLRVPPVN